MVRIIHLKRSKCDQFGAGADIILGRIGLPLCLVTAILKYIEVRGSASGLFFWHSDTQPGLKAWFVEQLRGILSAVGLPQQHYAGHSFHSGKATTAALIGVEDSTIQTVGRWHSAVYLQYISMPSEQLASLSSVLSYYSQSLILYWFGVKYDYVCFLTQRYRLQFYRGQQQLHLHLYHLSLLALGDWAATCGPLGDFAHQLALDRQVSHPPRHNWRHAAAPRWDARA